MKIRSLFSMVPVLMTLAGLSLTGSAAQAQDDFVYCGTKYPGWWRHLIGPKKLTDALKFTSFALNKVVGTTDLYTIDMTLLNLSTQVTPRMPVMMSFAMGDGSNYPNPDDPFNPNNPGNPYAIVQSQKLNAILIGLLKPGESFKISGRVRLQAKGAKMITLTMGYDDWDWCGTKPRPWPGPNPWWFKTLFPDPWAKGLTMDVTPLTEPQQGPFPGYETVVVNLSLTNNTGKSIAAGRPYQIVQRVVGGNGNPNPDDPFDPNGPWGPYADNFRITVAQGALPAVQAGATIVQKVKLTYPTQLGYANLMSLQIK